MKRFKELVHVFNKCKKPHKFLKKTESKLEMAFELPNGNFVVFKMNDNKVYAIWVVTPDNFGAPIYWIDCGSELSFFQRVAINSIARQESQLIQEKINDREMEGVLLADEVVERLVTEGIVRPTLTVGATRED